VAGSTVSRRVSEFFGVALFAAALIWLIALATYEPTDPVWFFSAGSAAQPANFAGRVGAFLAELSFQLLGYASHLIPAAMVVLGWHYFWCRTLDAQYTKLVGAGLLFGCVSSLLSLSFGSVDVDGKPFRAGGYLGEWLASWMAEYLNRTGSIIVILTFIDLATGVPERMFCRVDTTEEWPFLSDDIEGRRSPLGLLPYVEHGMLGMPY